MPGKRSPGIPARGFFNTKLEDIAKDCAFGAKLSAARREKCCGGRAGTGLGGRVLPRSPVLAAASFPETGCRPAPPFGADLQDCRSRTVRVGAACPFRAPSVPRRGGRGTDGEQTGNGRGWTAAEVSRRNGAAPFPARFLPRCGFRIAKIRRKNSLPMHAVLSFPDSILYLFVRNPVFFDGKVLVAGARLFVSK